MVGIIESIVKQNASGKQRYAAKGSSFFMREIDQRRPEDRQYIVEVCNIALKQMDAGIYYGTLKRWHVTSLLDYMSIYVEYHEIYPTYWSK
tara:strand:+ start:985 stop:1257 length:273 start_codon:yes stop_codon:yes gene_type:complete